MDHYLQIARAAVDHVAPMLRPGSAPSRMKGERDFSTAEDEAIEAALRGFLQSEAPEVGFWGEESGGGEATGLVWCVDPIDGTVNYSRGLPDFAISVALLSDGVPVVGVVRAPLLGEEYYAWRGGGAFLNGETICCGSVADLRGAIVSVGDFSTKDKFEAENARRCQLMESLANSVLRVRMFGSAALDLCRVASGATDATVIVSCHPWDIAAGAVIAEESGAACTYRFSEPWNDWPALIAGSSQVVAFLQGLGA